MLHRDPLGIVRGAFYALNRDYVTVQPVTAIVDPATATAPNADLRALVDGTLTEWTGVWAPTGSSSGCGPAPGTPTIVLTFPPTRVRKIQILPGLAKGNPGRALEPLPKDVSIDYAVPGRPCVTKTLGKADQQTPLALDSGQLVTSVRIGISSVYTQSPNDRGQVSITEIVLLAYPK